MAASSSPESIATFGGCVGHARVVGRNTIRVEGMAATSSLEGGPPAPSVKHGGGAPAGSVVRIGGKEVAIPVPASALEAWQDTVETLQLMEKFTPELLDTRRRTASQITVDGSAVLVEPLAHDGVADARPEEGAGGGVVRGRSRSQVLRQAESVSGGLGTVLPAEGGSLASSGSSAAQGSAGGADGASEDRAADAATGGGHGPGSPAELDAVAFSKGIEEVSRVHATGEGIEWGVDSDLNAKVACWGGAPPHGDILSLDADASKCGAITHTEPSGST